MAAAKRTVPRVHVVICHTNRSRADRQSESKTLDVLCYGGTQGKSNRHLAFGCQSWAKVPEAVQRDAS